MENIHKRLQNVYNDHALGNSNVSRFRRQIKRWEPQAWQTSTHNTVESEPGVSHGSAHNIADSTML